MSRGAGLLGAVLLALATLLGCSSLIEVDGGRVAIEVTAPVRDTVKVGQTLQLSARVLNADGEPVDAPIVWRTPDTTVTVDSVTGLVTGVVAGTGRVQASSGSLASELLSLIVIPATGP